MRQYVASMMNDRPTISFHTVSKYISGSSGCENKFPKKFYFMCNIMPRIINPIMSYTCMQHLKIEHQDNGSKLASGINSSVYRRLVVFRNKHYVGGFYDGSTEYKGVSYVSRSGSKLKEYCLIKFIDSVMKMNLDD